jgi:coatomer subunit gamma
VDLPEGFEVVKNLPCPRLEYNVSDVCYVIVATPEDVSEWVGTITPTLKFVVKDCDPATGEPDSNEG